MVNFDKLSSTADFIGSLDADDLARLACLVTIRHDNAELLLEKLGESVAIVVHGALDR